MATTSPAPNWVVLRDGEGKPCYYNTITRKTQWAPPSEQALPHYSTPPSYETAKEDGHTIHLTHDAQRLYWPVEGSWESAVRVMQDVRYDSGLPDPLGPPLRQETAIFQAPLTDPKISSATVRVQELECWEDAWMEMHAEHGDPGEDHEAECGNAVFGLLDDYDPDSDGEGISVGGSDDDDDADAEEEEERGHKEKSYVHLLRCCDAIRPRKKKASLLVQASGEYLTIHDYVSAVHPWLLSLRDDMLAASGDLMDNKPLLADTKLVVWLYRGPDEFHVVEDGEWRRTKAKRPVEKKTSQSGAAGDSLPPIAGRSEVLASTLENY